MNQNILLTAAFGLVLLAEIFVAETVLPQIREAIRTQIDDVNVLALRMKWDLKGHAELASHRGAEDVNIDQPK